MRLAFWRAVAEIGRRMTEAGERRVAPPKSIVEEIGAAWGRPAPIVYGTLNDAKEMSYGPIPLKYLGKRTLSDGQDWHQYQVVDHPTTSIDVAWTQTLSLRQRLWRAITRRCRG